MENNENPETAVIRGLQEETGLKLHKVELFKEEDVSNDPCRRGADFHFWHLYFARLDKPFNPNIEKEEGKKPVWFSTDQALKVKLTPPVKFFLKKYKEEIENLIENKTILI